MYIYKGFVLVPDVNSETDEVRNVPFSPFILNSSIICGEDPILIDDRLKLMSERWTLSNVIDSVDKTSYVYDCNYKNLTTDDTGEAIGSENLIASIQYDMYRNGYMDIEADIRLDGDAGVAFGKDRKLFLKKLYLPYNLLENAESCDGMINATYKDKQTIKDSSDGINSYEWITERKDVNTDVLGCELGGALKNIIALCAGICDGLGYGDNTKAAVMTRGMHEIVKLGLAMGGKSETFGGLTGMGDLIVTCTSMHSRNRRAGILIGKGVSPDEAVKQIGTVEGYFCCKAAYHLATENNASMQRSWFC